MAERAKSVSKLLHAGEIVNPLKSVVGKVVKLYGKTASVFPGDNRLVFALVFISS